MVFVFEIQHQGCPRDFRKDGSKNKTAPRAETSGECTALLHQWPETASLQKSELMKLKLKKLKRDQVLVMVRRISDFSQYLHFLQETEAKQVHFIHLSILTELQFEVMKKAMDPKIEETTSLSLNLHTAFILHSALLYREEDHEYYRSLQRRTIEELNQQLPRCTDIETESVNSEL